MLKDPRHPHADPLASRESDGIAPEDAEAYPGQNERRLSLRLLNYWRHLRGDLEFAARNQIDPQLIPEIWPFSFILDVTGGAPTAQFVFVGAEIARLSHVSTEVKAITEPAANTLLAQASSFLEQVLHRRCPVTIGGEFRDPSGNEILYRSILLPLSDDQSAVEAVLGAANCKLKD